MTNTERTLANVLGLMPANADMPRSVKDKLLASCGSISLADLVGHDGGSLAELLVAAAPDVVDECDILAVSERILRSIERMGYKIDGTAPALAEAPVSPAGPFTVTLAPAKKARDEMNLGELLDELLACPDDAEEIFELIRYTRTIRLAIAKLDGGQEWAIANEDGSLNRTETLAYARHLATDHTRPQPKWFGTGGTEYRPTTIEAIVGHEVEVLLYPFATTSRLDSVLLVGRDVYGRDWRTLPQDERHEAILWGVAVNHRNLVGNTNYRQLTEDLFSETLPPYLAELLEDFKYAKKNRRAQFHAEAKAITRVADDDVLRRAGRADLVGRGRGGSRLPFGGSADRDESWYREQLEEAALSAISQPAGAISRSRQILMGVRTGSGSITLTDCIVLGQVFTGSGSLNGTVWMRTGHSPTTGSGSYNINVRNWTYKKLYDKAVELGLL
ncbi:MAG TPA: hypothetical protein VJM32_05830 [Candidatus Saccharimonadales bacterium]|nr:hypothetical protein [Candidatus Saccharimonadales bacterium]